MQFDFPILDQRAAALVADLRAEAREWFKVAESRTQRRQREMTLTPLARFAMNIGADFEALADDLEIEATGGLQ